MEKKSITNILRTIITLGLLMFVFYKAGLFNQEGRASLFQLIISASIYYFMLSLFMSLLLNFSSALKWYMLLRSRDIEVGFGRIFIYYQIGKFFNLVLPTSMGGDVVRIYELGRYTGNNAETIASVFVERFSGMIMLTVVSLSAVIINIRTYNLPVITGSLGFCMVIIGVISWLILDIRPFNYAKKIIGGEIPLTVPIFTKMEKIHNAVMAYKQKPSALWVAMLNSLIFYFLAVINVWVSSLAFSPEVSFMGVLVAVPAILLIMNLPISIGGIGLMEFAYTLTFELIGYSAALGLSTALLIRAKTIIDGSVGGLFQLFYIKRP